MGTFQDPQNTGGPARPQPDPPTATNPAPFTLRRVLPPATTVRFSSQPKSGRAWRTRLRTSVIRVPLLLEDSGLRGRLCVIVI